MSTWPPDVSRLGPTQLELSLARYVSAARWWAGQTGWQEIDPAQ